MANYVDEAIAARKSGYDETQGFFDRQTMRKAGQAMAQGNRAGAAGELYGAGMIDAGRTLEQEGRNIEADTRKARMEDQELANNERKQKAEFLKQAATVLRQIPTEARAEAFTGKVAPALKAMGIPDDIIAQAGQHLDDTSLQTFIGEVNKAAEQYTLAPGSKRFDANGRLIAEAPFAPEYQKVGAGETLVEIGGGVGGGGDFGSHIGPMLEREGGFVASDGASGAPANFGINQRANPDIDVRNLTRDQAAQLYKERYWDAVGADQIPPEARAAVFDAAVNQGVDTAKQMWQQSGGDLGRFNDLRLQRYRQTPGYDKYGKSWERRVAETGGGARVIAQGQPKPEKSDAPSGYRWTAQGDLEAIPGGPAAEKAKGATKLAPQDSKYISEARTSAQQLSATVPLVDRFIELNTKVWTGGALGNNTLAGAAAMFDPRVAEMKAITDRLTPAMRQGMPGAASDRDVAMFQSATVGLGKPGPANQSVARALKAGAKRQADYVAFLENYAKENGSLLGAQEEWDAYAAANPMFDQDDKGNLTIRKQTPWRQYFGTSGGPAAAKGSSPASRPSLDQIFGQ